MAASKIRRPLTAVEEGLMLFDTPPQILPYIYWDNNIIGTDGYDWLDNGPQNTTDDLIFGLGDKDIATVAERTGGSK